MTSTDFNPRSPHGERQRKSTRKKSGCNFNPRSPHGERLRHFLSSMAGVAFQSTLPARGATIFTIEPESAIIYFNPRSPHGERLRHDGDNPRYVAFQSTLPARGATKSHPNNRFSTPFQSTLPARGATGIWYNNIADEVRISIHAPRTGSDFPSRVAVLQGDKFQSTLPARGATITPEGHFLRYGEDFNPRSPHGERRKALLACAAPKGISIHAPRTGSDQSPMIIAL